MSLRKQIKQKVMDLAYLAEKTLHRFRTEFEDKPIPPKPKGDDKPDETGQIRTYYNNSKEERKLH